MPWMAVPCSSRCRYDGASTQEGLLATFGLYRSPAAPTLGVLKGGTGPTMMSETGQC
jgi:hypothetical protein